MSQPSSVPESPEISPQDGGGRSGFDPQTSNFDDRHPPAQALLDDCVHCGFCMTTCPSYRVIGKEMDSPRGRIYLMDAINGGEADLNKITAQHFDSCLGCLACTTACPSGVEYDHLIAATRPQVERNVPRSPWEKAIRWVIFNLFPYPQRLGLLLPLLWLYQRSPLPWILRKTGVLRRFFPRLGAMESILPRVVLGASRNHLPDRIPAQGPPRYRVGMILGCVQRLFFSPVNEATARVLTANGCEVIIPKGQGCCAALPAHQGQETQAQAIAKQMIDSFADEDLDFIIINAAGCGHTLKEYGEILGEDPEYGEKARQFAAKVRDIHEFLGEVGLTAELHPITATNLTLVYQDACHLLHGQKISVPPRQLLRQIPGVTLKEPLDSALCCGSAGVYNLLQPQVAAELGQQKAKNLVATGAQLIASPNPGCALQIQKHLQEQQQAIAVRHPVELLDLAIRGESLPEL